MSRATCVAFLAVIAAANTTVVSGQTYPTKPIRMIVPFAPGRCPGSRRGGWCWGGDGAMTPGLWHCAQRWLAIAIVLMTSLWIAPVVAQTYPSKPIRMIVPFAPGGGTDNLARILSKKMSETFGQSVVVDNRGGAGGIVGTELAARSAADGHTILITSSAHTVRPATYGKIPYDPLKDVAPISLLTAQPYLMVIHPSVPASSVKDFIALAKSRPGQLNYASGGFGPAPHPAAELLK